MLFIHKEQSCVVYGKWVQQEIIMLSELSQPQNYKYHVFHLSVALRLYVDMQN